MDRQRIRPRGKHKQAPSLGVELLCGTALASTAAVGEFLEMRRTCTGLFETPPPVDEPLWLRYYDSPRTWEAHLMKGMFGDLAGEFILMLKTLRNPVGKSLEAKLAAFMVIAAFFSPAPAEWPNELTKLLETDPAADEGETEPLSPECACAMEFLLWVYLPCWLKYGVTPTKLLRRLSGGGEEAEEAGKQLVRLDRRVVSHRKVQRWINAEPRTARFRRERVARWSRMKPFDRDKAGTKQLRVLSGFASDIAELCHERKEEPEVRELIIRLGSEIPPELLEYLMDRTGDDFSREIRRHKGHFSLPPKPDRSILRRVRALWG